MVEQKLIICITPTNSYLYNVFFIVISFKVDKKIGCLGRQPFFVTIGNIFSLLITWSFIPFLQLFQDYFHTVIQPFLIAGHMFTYVVNQTSYNNKDNP